MSGVQQWRPSVMTVVWPARALFYEISIQLTYGPEVCVAREPCAFIGVCSVKHLRACGAVTWRWRALREAQSCRAPGVKYSRIKPLGERRRRLLAKYHPTS